MPTSKSAMRASRRIARRSIFLCLAAGLVLAMHAGGQAAFQAAGDTDRVVRSIEAVSVTPTLSPEAIRALDAAIGARRLVLLGENGHGVSEFTVAKVEIVKWLHEHRGFDVVAFESGFYECGNAAQRIGQSTAAEAMRTCLLTQFHHNELVPLFEHMARTAATARPLSLEGLDFQVQGSASRSRSARFADVLRPTDAGRANRLETLDAAYVEKNLAPTEEKIAWVRENGRALRELHDSAAAAATGELRWTLQAASELMRRELVRTDALDRQQPVGREFYEIRDEWMARSVARLIQERPDRRVVVWMHNDHARYGEWEQGDVRVRASGGFLRERFPKDVLSIGFLMGQGTFADNFRRPREVAALPPGAVEHLFANVKSPQAWLNLSALSDAAARRWADDEHAYVRGTAVARMRPGREFDALLYFAKVTPPTYLGSK